MVKGVLWTGLKKKKRRRKKKKPYSPLFLIFKNINKTEIGGAKLSFPKARS